MADRFVDVLFSDYIPDESGIPNFSTPGYLTQAQNVRRTPQGYRPTYGSATAGSATVGAVAASAFGVFRSSNENHFVASSQALWQTDDDGVTWNDNSATAYAASAEWDWAVYETYVYAASVSNVLQRKQITDAVTTNFADVTGTAVPQGNVIARIRDHLVIGYLSTSPHSIQWSAIGAGSWPTPGSATALANQAGSLTLDSSLGYVTNITDGEKFGLVFQTNSITRMTYIGGDAVFQFDRVSEHVGSRIFRNVANIDGRFYFIAKNGVYVTDGYAIKELSLGKIKDAICVDILSYGEGMDSVNSGWAYDSRTGTVMWPFVGGGSALFLCYHISTDSFSVVSTANTPLGGSLYSVADESLSEYPWFIDANNLLMKMTDTTAVSAAIQTGYIEIDPGYRTMVTGAMPIGTVDGTHTLSVKSADTLADANLDRTGFTALSASNNSDIERVRSSGRYHAFRFAQNMDINMLVKGLRVYYERLSEL